MKSVKFLVMVALAGMVMGCSKHSEPVMQEIRIGIGNVQSGSMATKGVADALSATAPSGIVQLSLQGVDVTSRRYQVAADGSVSVPVGRYSVKGAYKPTALGTAVFNSVYGEVFKVPEPFISEVGARIYGLTSPGDKMSKSDPAGCVFIMDSPEEIARKFKRAITDSDILFASSRNK